MLLLIGRFDADLDNAIRVMESDQEFQRILSELRETAPFDPVRVQSPPRPDPDWTFYEHNSPEPYFNSKLAIIGLGIVVCSIQAIRAVQSLYKK